MSFLVVCCLSCGAPGAGAYLEKTGFRMEGVSIFAFGPSARAAQQPRKRDEKSIAKSQNAQRTAHAERTRTNVQKSSFLEPQALRNRPQGSPKRPRKRVEAAGWQTQRKFATKNIPGTPPKASKSLRRAMRLSPGAPRGLRVTGFAHPGPLGTDNYQRK